MQKATEFGWETNENFFRKGARHIGFKGTSIVFELVDNSIDAESTEIDITFKNNSDDTKDISVSDNGNGFKYGTLKESVKTWGSTREYDNTQIGNFGVGMSAIFNEVVQDGGSVKIRTSDGSSGKTEILEIKMNEEHSKVGFSPAEEINLDGSSFTTIELFKVNTKLKMASLIKKASVVYFPNFDRNTDFKMTIKNGKGIRTNIDFVDPFYRDLSDKDSNGAPVIKTFVHEFTFENEIIDIYVRGFYPGFDSEFKSIIKERRFDKSGEKDQNWVPVSNSGLYLRYGGRYINIGERLMPGSSHGGHNFSGLRFEIEIPKHLQNFPINVDKDKLIIDDSDIRLTDLFRVVKQIRNQYMKFYERTRGDSSHSKEFFEYINTFVSKMITGSNLKTLIDAHPTLEGKEIRVRTGDNPGTRTPTGTGRKRRGKYSGPGLIVKGKKGAKTDPLYSWDNVPGEGLVTLTYNENSELYRVFLKQGGKKGISTLALLHYFELYGMKNVSNEKSDTNDQKQTVQDFEDTVDELTRLSNKQLKK
tara:strand:- start:89 stop:1684 length:1596 start_codon:yes stop_codon:yes gene_type:complete